MWPDAQETQALLSQARQGEKDAVEQLLGRHREPLRQVVSLRLDPAIAARLDASDVVQDVLLEASRRLDTYLRDPAMPFHLWLRHIARDHLIDAHADRSSVELAAQFLDQELTPASAAIRQEMQRRLHAAIADLEEDDREVV